MPGKSLTPNPDLGLSHAPAMLGRLSPPQAHLAVGGALGSTAASPSLHPSSGAVSSVKPNQPNKSASELVKNPELLSSTGGPATAPRPAKTNSGQRPRPSPMDPMAKRQHPPRCRCRLMGQRQSSSPRRALRSSALHAAPNSNGSLLTRDRNEFV